MNFIFIFLILICFGPKCDSNDIEVLNSGLLKLRREDMTLILFVTIHHHGEKARNVMATMVECCEKINDDDTDCDAIQIFGEHLGVVQPGATVNVTFLYPNIYGYNRRASCLIDIWNRIDGINSGDVNEIRHRIDFDTSIKIVSQGIPYYLQGLYSPETFVPCETTDLDPFDGCNPVNCKLKYSGVRNYFNNKRKRCQKVPICNGDPNKDLPDIVYLPSSNICRNLEQAVSSDDIKELIAEKYETSSHDLEGKMVNIQCHHGEIDVRTGLCICDKGWTSESFDPEDYNQGTVYHMCDKKCHPDVPTHYNTTAIILGLVLAAWILFLVILCESCNYFCDFRRTELEAEEEEEICYYPVGED